MTITKKNISNLLSEELNLNKKNCDDFISIFLKIISKELKYKNVKLNNFGSFINKKTKQRIGRNPKTLESYIIPSTEKVILLTSKKIKEALNWFIPNPLEYK